MKRNDHYDDGQLRASIEEQVQGEGWGLEAERVSIAYGKYWYAGAQARRRPGRTELTSSDGIDSSRGLTYGENSRGHSGA